MHKARYFDLKRFAIHDGPGIRTTLFLKGCPLSCIWCHNPEGISAAPELAFYPMRCALCGDCEQMCSCHQITDAAHVFHRETCLACGRCEEVCLHGALELFGKFLDSGQAAALLLEDRRFYRDGGGITLSGGEPLMQSEFCAELLALLKEEGIHCAVDTCGEVPWKAFERVLPFTDLFLYDFKVADSALHKTFTGCGNKRILANLARLDQTGIPFEIRMPMIPAHNMDVQNLENAAVILSGLRHLTAVRLLPYHAQAHSKYQAIGRTDTLPQVPSPNADALENVAELLRRRKLRVINPLTNGQ